MAYIPDQRINTGLYVPSTNVWDLGILQEIDVNSPEFKELLVRLYQNVNNIAISLNLKDSAIYIQEEFVTGAQFFNPASSSQLLQRAEFRSTYNIGALGAGVTNTAHGLTIGATWVFTQIWGTASDNIGPNYYPLPWASAGGATNIELRVDGVNIVITNNSGIAFTSCIVVLEYVKN
jgi:hypothetical protein